MIEFNVPFLTIDDIVGNSKKNIPALIPVGKSTWYAGVKEGVYPQPVKLYKRRVAWRAEEIKELILKLEK